MAIQVITEVWEHSKASGSQLLVLLALADRARPEDGVCWPGIMDIALRARLHERQTQRCIQKLILRGELKCIKQGGGNQMETNTYQVSVGRYAGVTGDTRRGDFRDTGRGVTLGKRGVTGGRRPVSPSTPKPSVNRQEPVDVVTDIDEKTGRLRLKRA